jgi:hypothetical protein
MTRLCPPSVERAFGDRTNKLVVDKGHCKSSVAKLLLRPR